MKMATRNRPLLSGKLPFHDESEDESESIPKEIELNDDVDHFFDQRHQSMLKDVQHEDSDNEKATLEPELIDRGVMDIHASSSEDSSSSDAEEDDGSEDSKQKKRGWGANRKNWYGGDTHEYEIMDDAERDEALKDEEEEALRMQKKALETLQPEDFQDEDEDETLREKEVHDAPSDSLEVSVVHGGKAGNVLTAAAPEVPVLLKEMLRSRKEADIWYKKAKSSEVARLIYHLHASLVTNVAYFLSLRTDPEAHGMIDTRTHPVLVRILTIRELLQQAASLPLNKTGNAEPSKVRESSRNNAKSKHLSNSEETPQVLITQQRGEDEPDLEAAVTSIEDLKKANSDPSVDMENKSEKKKKRKRKRSRAQLNIAKDEEKVKSLLEPSFRDKGGDKNNDGSAKKRRKLQKIVNEMECRRINQEQMRIASADVELVRKEKRAEKSTVELRRSEDDEDNESRGADDDEIMHRMLSKQSKKEAKKERKLASNQPHVYRFDDKADPEGKRKASSQVVKNKGLTRYRPRSKKTPRTKNRLAYTNAVKRRKGAVREYAGKPGVSYSGEASGINMSVRKGTRLSEV